MIDKTGSHIFLVRTNCCLPKHVSQLHLGLLSSVALLYQKNTQLKKQSNLLSPCLSQFFKWGDPWHRQKPTDGLGTVGWQKEVSTESLSLSGAPPLKKDVELLSQSSSAMLQRGLYKGVSPMSIEWSLNLIICSEPFRPNQKMACWFCRLWKLYLVSQASLKIIFPHSNWSSLPRSIRIQISKR